MPTDIKPPVHEIRFGVCKCAIWRHVNARSIQYTVSFSRSFLENATGNDPQWKDTHFWSGSDLLVLSKLANEAHSWIYQRIAEEKDSRALAEGQR